MEVIGRVFSDRSFDRNDEGGLGLGTGLGCILTLTSFSTIRVVSIGLFGFFTFAVYLIFMFSSK